MFVTPPSRGPSPLNLLSRCARSRNKLPTDTPIPKRQGRDQLGNPGRLRLALLHDSLSLYFAFVFVGLAPGIPCITPYNARGRRIRLGTLAQRGGRESEGARGFQASAYHATVYVLCCASKRMCAGAGAPLRRFLPARNDKRRCPPASTGAGGSLVPSGRRRAPKSECSACLRREEARRGRGSESDSPNPVAWREDRCRAPCDEETARAHALHATTDADAARRANPHFCVKLRRHTLDTSASSERIAQLEADNVLLPAQDKASEKENFRTTHRVLWNRPRCTRPPPQVGYRIHSADLEFQAHTGYKI
ncbi:hypothetical protein K438DRAFT_1759376 [Mycena galopus ATCC 62051]|nr:hypothetical protein K438DRAFT_1759376 [Mycena galopus ATCC 62051]